MDFNTLKYSEKIEIAKLFFRKHIYNGTDLDFIPKSVSINYNKFEFYSKAFGDVQYRVSEIENFFNKNGKLIRKEKLLQIRKNLT